MEVTKKQALILYNIKKGLTINVGHWISVNIRHAALNVSLGIPHPTLVTELIAVVGENTLGQEILQLKNPLNCRAIKRITRVDGGGECSGASMM